MREAGEPGFEGFPQEALAFTKELEENNTRKWFEGHRREYEEHVLVPARAFVICLGEKLIDLVDGITYDTRTSGCGSLMRIHRDLRFSKDKTPYHTHIRVIFWHVEGNRTHGPGFHIGFNHAECGLYAGQYSLGKGELEAYRRAVDGDNGDELAKAISLVEGSGDYHVGGHRYKRVPRGFPPEHPRAELLRYGGLYAMTQVDPAMATAPDFADVCFEHFGRMAPLVRWLVSLHGWD